MYGQTAPPVKRACTGLMVSSERFCFLADLLNSQSFLPFRPLSPHPPFLSPQQLPLVGNDPYATKPCNVVVDPLVYKIGSEMVTPTVCQDETFGNACLKQYELGWNTRDAITVTFHTAPNASAVGVKYSARLCYAPAFSLDRPWRKPKAVVAKDKHCPFKMGVTAPGATSGNFTFHLPSDIPKGVYYVTVIAQNATTQAPIGRGLSPQYVQVRVMDGTTPGMIAGVIVLSITSVTILAVFMLQDYIRDRMKKSS